MLRLEDLVVEVAGKEILHGINLELGKGEVHLLFGPNGSGKSTLLGTLMGLPQYRVKRGRIYFQDTDITELPIEERAELGLGMAFQRPPVIKGVRLRKLLETITNGADIEKLAEELKLSAHLDRDLHLGFSGGESKRVEILTLMVQQPKLMLLDEPESGVDLENIELIAKKVAELLGRTSMLHKLRTAIERSALIISHTGHILDHLHADRGHVLVEGRLVCSANPLDILETIKAHGYSRCVECLKELGRDVEVHT